MSIVSVNQHRGWNGVSRCIAISCLLAIACALALWLRLRQAQASIVFDEYASLYFSEQSFHDLWGYWLLRETNPPLFYSILKVWRWLVPESQESLRVLPLLISLLQIGFITWFARRQFGWLAALACLLLFAVSPSDIYQSEYLRGYALAKLAVSVSFVGLVTALTDGERQWRGWIAYAAGSVVAIYSHTTMLLWPAIASTAVLVDAGLRRSMDRDRLVRLLIADVAIAGLSAWELWISLLQMRGGATNIAWIEPLSIEDFWSSVNLQLLLGGTLSSWLMAGLVLIGAFRTFASRVTRMSAMITVLSLFAFRAADRFHPVTTDFTLHWCATFTVLLAAAAFAEGSGVVFPAWKTVRLALLVPLLFAMVGEGVFELDDDRLIPIPQDWRYVIKQAARTPAAALLVSHESIGVIVQQACMVQFHAPRCPFPLVVMQNDAASDSWAVGGYGGTIVPAEGVRTALGSAETVFAFSRYVYTPLERLGLNPRDYHEIQWDDGELIGPIPIADFETIQKNASPKIEG